MKMHESGENYLETILLLEMQNSVVRSVDIANHLEYSKPSVSRAMSILKKAGYIVMDEADHISLTNTGYAIANRLYERHRLLTRYLTALGVNEDTASADACRIEHVISEESFEKIKEHITSLTFPETTL